MLLPPKHELLTSYDDQRRRADRFKGACILLSLALAVAVWRLVCSS